MKLLCSTCGRDLNEIWQANMSCIPGVVLCEDCSGHTAKQEDTKGYTDHDIHLYDKRVQEYWKDVVKNESE